MEEDKINNKIKDVLASLDGSASAEPQPFLLTRIKARLQKSAPASFWTTAFTFISRPLVAGFGVLLFLIVNVIIIFQNKNADYSNIATQNSSAVKDEFAINVVSIYDIENQ